MSRPLRILDVGAHDGYVSRWLMERYDGPVEICGLELHPPACAKARERGIDCKIGRAEDAPFLFPPGSFDAVIAYELIEHVPDVDALLSALEEMLTPTGRLYLSTPEGTFGDGHNAQHLRAYRAVDLADLLRRRGELIDMAVVAGVTVAVYRPAPRLADVAIYTGPGLPWSPMDIETTGLGGSETAAVRVAEQLSAIGWVVTVYGEVEDCCFRDVIFRHWTVFDGMEPRQAVIASRMPEVVDRPLRANRKLLWLHDVDCEDRLTAKRAERFDRVLTLSDWHTGHVGRRYPFLREGGKIEQTRNGYTPAYFAGEQPDRVQRVVFTSSPDRGLDILLEMWPRIREQAPDAELAFCCSPFYEQVAARVPHIAEHRELIRRLEAQPGVARLGSLNQPGVARLLRSSMVWAHPSFSTPAGVPFHETSCIAAMEAQAAGCLAVASNWGALSETVRAGRLIDGPALSNAWRDALVTNIVEGLTDPAVQEWAQTRGPEAVADLGWRDVGVQVAALIR